MNDIASLSKELRQVTDGLREIGLKINRIASHLEIVADGKPTDDTPDPEPTSPGTSETVTPPPETAAVRQPVDVEENVAEPTSASPTIDPAAKGNVVLRVSSGVGLQLAEDAARTSVKILFVNSHGQPALDNADLGCYEELPGQWVVQVPLNRLVGLTPTPEPGTTHAVYILGTGSVELKVERHTS